MTKPASWAWDADLVVNDGHRTLAQSLTWLVPLWEGTGTPGELVQAATASAATGSWQTSVNAGISGPVWRTTANTHFIRFAGNTNFLMDGDIDFSWLVTIDKTGTSGAAACGYLAARATFAAGFWEVYFGGSNIGWSFHNGTNNLQENFGADLTTGLHMLCGSRQASTNQFRVWVDGSLRNTITQAAIPSSQSHDMVIGRLATDATDSQFGDYALVAIWKNYLLTQSDVTLMTTNNGFDLITQTTTPAYELSDYRYYDDLGSGLGETA